MCDPEVGPSLFTMRSGSSFIISFLHPFLMIFLDNYSENVSVYLFVLEEKHRPMSKFMLHKIHE